MTLIPNWRDCWRFWSVRLQVAGVFLLGVMEVFPNVFFSIWVSVPADVAATVPVAYIRYAGYAAIFCGVVARIIRQPALHKTDGPT